MLIHLRHTDEFESEYGVGVVVGDEYTGHVTDATLERVFEEGGTTHVEEFWRERWG